MPIKAPSVLALAIALPLSFPVLAVEPAARAEINYLLDQLGQSGCEFYRDAGSHLQPASYLVADQARR